MKSCSIECNDLLGPLFGPPLTEAEIDQAIKKRLTWSGFDLTRPFKAYLLLNRTFIFTQEPRVALACMLPDWDWAAYAFAALYWTVVALVFARCLL